MFTVCKRLEIAGSHQLHLNYSSKCENLHGHNWIIKIYVRAKELNEVGMVLDFTHIKKNIHDYLDHQNLNQVFDFNPTAENIAKWISERVEKIDEKVDCFRVEVQESEGNIAIWEKDND